MLLFDCPHCGNHLRLEDEFAGSDGWCRACKGMIVAPRPGRESAGFDSLPIEARYNRLYQIFRFAATKADNYKLLLSRLASQRDMLRQELAKASAQREGADDVLQQLATLQQKMSARDEELAAAVAIRRQLEDEVLALTRRLDSSKQAMAPPPDDPSTTTEMQNANAQIAAERERATRLERNWQEALNASKLEAQLHAEVVEELNATRVALSDAQKARQAADLAHAQAERALAERTAALEAAERRGAPGPHTTRVAELEAQLREAQAQCESHRSRLHEVEVDRDTLAEQASTALARLRKEHEALAAEYTRVAELLDGLTALREEHEQLRSDHDMVVQTVAPMEALRHELETLRAQQESLVRERDALRAEHTRALGELNALTALRDDYERLRADRDAVAQTAAPLEALYRELNELRAQHEALTRERDTLINVRQEYDTLRAQHDGQAAEHESVEALRQELAALRTQYDGAMQELDALGQEYDALEAALETPSFGALPDTDPSELLSPMPAAPTDANGMDEHVIIPEIVMEELDRRKSDPVVSALLRFLQKQRDNDEEG